MCKQTLAVKADQSLDELCLSPPFTVSVASEVRSIRFDLRLLWVKGLKGKGRNGGVDCLVEYKFSCILRDLIAAACFKEIREARDDGYCAGFMFLQ